MEKIIGREKEQKELQKLFNMNKSILLAIYGRRRVGKTYLINEFFNGEFTFKHTGASNNEYKTSTSDEKLNMQLGFFSDSLRRYGSSIKEDVKTWKEAFNELTKIIENDNHSRKVIFIDEMPWIETENSFFLTSFEHFWNDYGSARNDILFIVCGSATSWITNNLINGKGGLYDRVNYEIKLEPLSLSECEKMCEENGINWRRYQIIQAYMAIGGIPFYFGYLDNSLTLEQNIDNLFFTKNSKMRNEFDRLFDSTFDRPDVIKNIVKILSKTKTGLSRDEIAQALCTKSGGTLTKLLQDLIESDYVLKYKSYNTKERVWKYKLIDPFCLFYLKFVENHQAIDEYFWSKNFTSQSTISWRGNVFEIVCFNHIPQIKNKLGISGLSTREALWSDKGDENKKGSQIDLIIERNDNIINLCEAKFYGNEYALDKTSFENLNHHEEAFASVLNKKNIIEHVLITTFGLKNNMYSDIYKKVVTLDDLFN